MILALLLVVAAILWMAATASPETRGSIVFDALVILAGAAILLALLFVRAAIL